MLSVFTCKTSFYEHITACDIVCAFLTEETTQIKNNVVQLVLISNITRNTLDHKRSSRTSLWFASSVHEQAGLPRQFWGAKFSVAPPPQRKGIRFLFLPWFDPPLVWAPGQMSLLPPPPL